MSAYSPVLTAFAGVVIGGLITFAVQFYAQRKEDKRAAQRLSQSNLEHLNRLAIEAGIAEYRQYAEITMRLTEMTKREPAFYPAEDYILRYIFFFRELNGIDTSRPEFDAHIAALLRSSEERAHKINNRPDRAMHDIFGPTAP